MDLEPGRCRRTDGRKWRCRENVVTDQKYCKGHMNRGSLRSRKPVEAAENISRSKSPTIICPNKPTKTITSQFKNPSSNTSNNIPSTPETITDSANAKSRGNNNLFVNSDPFSGTVAIKICKGNNSNSNSNVNASKDITAKNGKDAGFKYISDQKKNRNSKNGEKDSRVVTPGSGLSRMSVLQGDTEIEEPQRCKRTDGRKWRCSREVVPEHKYCDTHMNKGAKRRATSTLAAPLLATIPKPNTNLSVSPVESPSPQPTSDDDSTDNDSTSSSSSSDATTSTDKNAGGVAHIFLLKR